MQDYPKEYLDELYYTRLKIPYFMRDECVNELAQYQKCLITDSLKWMPAPIHKRLSRCEQDLMKRWLVCQTKREFRLHKQKIEG